MSELSQNYAFDIATIAVNCISHAFILLFLVASFAKYNHRLDLTRPARWFQKDYFLLRILLILITLVLTLHC